MHNTFFTGCSHFNHDNIRRLANRPFSSVEEMNETMIERWNAKVPVGSIVYHLGDVGWFKNRDQMKALLSRLNGQIWFVEGNHDYPSTRTAGDRWEPYRELRLPDGKRLVLFHYPIEEWNGFFKGNFHLHCHTHQHDRKGKVPIERRVNVTVEAWDYAPAHLDEIMAVWP